MKRFVAMIAVVYALAGCSLMRVDNTPPLEYTFQTEKPMYKLEADKALCEKHDHIEHIVSCMQYKGNKLVAVAPFKD